MGIFDSLKQQAQSQLKREATKAVSNAVSNIGKGKNHSESFTFSALPASLTELKALPEAALDSAFKTTALTMLALCRYEQDPAACLEMLDFLKGPADVSPYEKQFIQERLKGKEYKVAPSLPAPPPKTDTSPPLPTPSPSVRIPIPSTRRIGPPST